MCYRTAAAQNAARAHLLNMGIVLLGLPPFCILGGFIFLAWRRNQAFAAEPQPDAESLDPADAIRPVAQRSSRPEIVYY